VIGHADLAKVAVAIERDVAAKRAASTTYTPVKTATPEIAESAV
jgi:hypothetical protein